MRIRHLTTSADVNGVVMAGTVRDVSEAEAHRFVDGGFAEALEPFAVPAEQPAVQPEEKPAKKTRSRKTKGE